MISKLQQRLAGEEKGFTLIELLVVILIIGILAAIALPAFLGQRSKGQDASAKSDARNMVSQIESCYTDQQNYGSCTTATALGNTGLAIGASTGQVYIPAADATTYSIVAFSKSGNAFSITKDATGVISRACSSAGSSSGSCQGGTW